MLWKVRLSIHKKCALGGIFSITVIIMVVAIIRVVMVSSQQPDASWFYLWSSIEQAVCKFPTLSWKLYIPRLYLNRVHSLNPEQPSWSHVLPPFHRSLKNPNGRSNTSGVLETAAITSGRPFRVYWPPATQEAKVLEKLRRRALAEGKTSTSEQPQSCAQRTHGRLETRMSRFSPQEQST